MKIPLALAVCLLAGCAGEKQALVVKQYTLRTQDVAGDENPMVRQEKLRRLYGAVTIEERAAKLGQYYTILWNLPNDTNADRKVIFYYQQGGSGSLVKTMSRDIPKGLAHGKEEFGITGEDYFERGRVLTWKTDLIVEGKTVASEQSYLWE